MKCRIRDGGIIAAARDSDNWRVVGALPPRSIKGFPGIRTGIALDHLSVVTTEQAGSVNHTDWRQIMVVKILRTRRDHPRQLADAEGISPTE